jgi:hypothetical protein
VAKYSEEQVRTIFVRRRKIVAVILVFLLAFTGFFVYRTVERARYWSRHRDAPIRGWMTVGYVARSHRVRPSVLKTAIGLPPEERDRRPLAEIARTQNRSVDDLAAILEQAIEKERLQRPPPNDGGGP